MGERIAVLVSGSGTNLQALLDDPVCGPRIALVLSDRPGVTALDRAETHGVDGAVLEPKDFEGREAFDRAVAEFQETLRINPKHESAANNLARAEEIVRTRK